MLLRGCRTRLRGAAHVSVCLQCSVAPGQGAVIAGVGSGAVAVESGSGDVPRSQPVLVGMCVCVCVLSGLSLDAGGSDKIKSYSVL